MSKRLLILILALLTAVNLACFRGTPSDNPPIHLNPNMDTQGKLKPYRESTIFKDGSGMRLPVEHTIARGFLKDNDKFFRGKLSNGEFVAVNPLPMDKELLERGRERYDIFCAPCHSRLGDGHGIIMQYNFPIPPPTFHQDRVREFKDGYFFSVISDGVRNMPGYKHQIPVADRWAIVAYVRALQKSQNASLGDIPTSVLKTIK